MRVLVTDSDNRSALAAARALGARGHDVFTAGERHPSLASVSRHATGFDRYSSPYREPARCVDEIREILTRRQIDVVLPMTEITTLLLTEHQDSFPPHVHIPFPATAIVSAASDKANVLRIAEQIGVPAPRTTIVSSPEEARELAARLAYPLVIKPARSRVWNGRTWLTSRVSYSGSPGDLVGQVSAIARELYPLLLQERIEGHGSGVFLCCDEHGVAASFAHRRLREKPPSGGVSVLSESIAVDPVALEHATRLLEHLRWRGVAMVEFKHDRRDGQLKLMEINGRFWGSLQLAIDAGVDFPGMAVDLALGNRLQRNVTYKVGRRCRWLLGDVDAMLALLLRSREQLNLPASHPGRWRTLHEFMKLWQADTRFELERRDDLKPGLLELRRWLLGRN